MLKLEDFKMTEIDTIKSVTGGGHATIYETCTVTNFLGWIITSNCTGDMCNSCDSYE